MNLNPSGHRWEEGRLVCRDCGQSAYQIASRIERTKLPSPCMMHPDSSIGGYDLLWMYNEVYKKIKPPPKWHPRPWGDL